MERSGRWLLGHIDIYRKLSFKRTLNATQTLTLVAFVLNFGEEGLENVKCKGGRLNGCGGQVIHVIAIANKRFKFKLSSQFLQCGDVGLAVLR
jgi:hypothetical protein